MTTISDNALQMIVGFEVSDEATYNKTLHLPEWPGDSSGITIGIGYDLGYATEAKIRSDWTNVVSDQMVDSMVKYSGMTGETANSNLSEAKQEIDIPWNDAMSVFSNIDMVMWTNKVVNILPNTDKLSGDSLGALVSLAFNRGASFNNSGDRYTEMRNIKTHMQAQEFDKIPDEFRSMKRLWPNTKGLRDRRDDEANMFQQGLS